jgi:NAD(P)-dependent dehydrogenase (short-subunit alcohol dehydrogenase family)
MTRFLFDNVADVNNIGFIPLGRAGRAEDIAGLAIFLASRAGAYFTGGVIPVDGGVATHG